jgi:hypothetical protein
LRQPKSRLFLGLFSNHWSAMPCASLTR